MQPWPNFSGNFVIPSSKSNEYQKKGFRRKLKFFFPEIEANAIWDYIQPEFVRFIRAGWLLIVSSSSAQISLGGRLNLDGETLTLDGGTRPPYNLCTGCTHIIALKT